MIIWRFLFSGIGLLNRNYQVDYQSAKFDLHARASSHQTLQGQGFEAKKAKVYTRLSFLAVCGKLLIVAGVKTHLSTSPQPAVQLRTPLLGPIFVGPIP